MGSWIEYGRKSARAGSADACFLGHECPGSALCPGAEEHTCFVSSQALRDCRLVGNAGRSCECLGSPVAHEAVEPTRVDAGTQHSVSFYWRLDCRSALECSACRSSADCGTVRCARS